MKHVNYVIMLLVLLVSTVSHAQVTPFPVTIQGLTIDNQYFTNDQLPAQTTDIYTTIVRDSTRNTVPTTLQVYSTAAATITVSAEGLFLPQQNTPQTAQVISTSAALPADQTSTISLGSFNYFVGIRQVAFRIIISISYAGQAVNHTYFVYNQALPLPVTLVDFTTKPVSSGVIVSWATAMEKDFSYFGIESSINGISFQEIGRAPAKGVNSSSRMAYSFLDSKPLTTTTYYRLRIVDLNRTVKYSPVRALVSPIRVTSEYVVHFGDYFYHFRIPQGEVPTGIQVLDTAGRLVVNQVGLEQPNFRPTGDKLYILRVVTDRGSVKAQTVR